MSVNMNISRWTEKKKKKAKEVRTAREPIIMMIFVLDILCDDDAELYT